MMRRLFQIVPVAVLMLLAVADAHAQAGVFSRMGFGARGVSMGGALVAERSGWTSPYYNPALAVFVPQQNLEASAALMSQDRELQFLQLSAPLPPRAGVAVGLVHAAVTGIDGRDASGQHTGELRTDEFDFFLAFGLRASEKLSIGLGMQVFRSQLYEAPLRPSLAIGIDAGAVYAVSDALALGIAVDDFLARYTYDTSRIYGEGGKSTTDNFPVRLRVGGAYTRGPLVVTAEVEARATRREQATRGTEVRGGQLVYATTTTSFSDGGSLLRVGAEYAITPAFTLRGGVEGVGMDGIATGARPSVGFGVEQPAGPLVLRGGYGFVLEPYGTGTLHLVTLQVLL